jgi:hypothetical protein
VKNTDKIMSRKLKVEYFNPTGKLRLNPASIIRLKGQWLSRLGFGSGQYVELTAIPPGVLEIRLCGVNPVSAQIK